MNYNTLTNELSRRTGISQDIFDINLDTEILEYEDYSLRKYAFHEEQSNYIEKYNYKENSNERWEAVTLYIYKHKVDEFLKALNLILAMHDHDKINVDEIPDKFEYHDQGLLYLIGFNKETHLQVDIARKKD